MSIILYHKQRAVTLGSNVQYRKALIVNLVDICPIFLQKGYHFEVAPENRIVETSEPLIVPGT